MDTIYLTKGCKQDIEDEIANLKKRLKKLRHHSVSRARVLERISVLKEILSLAIIIPVEHHWANLVMDYDDREALKNDYKDGVIIKPKK
jgi:hypothetical protein